MGRCVLVALGRGWGRDPAEPTTSDGFRNLSQRLSRSAPQNSCMRTASETVGISACRPRPASTMP